MTIAYTYTYQHVIDFARSLPLNERVKLVCEILAEPVIKEPQFSSRSLIGYCSDLEIMLSEEQIDEARREMWGKFYE